jgi:hypothetical protein
MSRVLRESKRGLTLRRGAAGDAEMSSMTSNHPLHLTAGVGPAEAFGLRLARRR